VGEVPLSGDGRTGGRAQPAAAAPGETAGTGPLTPTHVPEERVEPGVPVPGHDELPLPDFDHMTLGSLRGRLRRLDLAALEQLRAYEQAHARRLPILTMLENRIAKIGEPGGDTPAAEATEASEVPDEPADGPPASEPPRSQVPPEPRGDLPAQDVPAQDGPPEGAPVDPAQPPG
ncbi:MAG TPA: hypothetical protein VKP11_11230, partial [Frankiaceae bacterium]|nr:hypothetical protein [Frankiaceae bacterium]